MASSGSLENEGIAELLKETLKELRNISSELGEQSKAIQAMTKTHLQPLSPAAEQPMDNNTTKSRLSRSASPSADQSERLGDSHRPEESEFWGDIDERFFWEKIPPDYLEFASTPMHSEYPAFLQLLCASLIIKNELYYNQNGAPLLQDEQQVTTTLRDGPVIAPLSSSTEESRMTSSSAVNDALDISVTQPSTMPSHSSEVGSIPQTAAAQPIKRSSISSKMNSAPEISGMQSLREPSTSSAVNSALPASVAQSVRESRISASTERSVSFREIETWDWFKKLPYDCRLGLDLNFLPSFVSTVDRFGISETSFEIRDWIHQRCFFHYDLFGVTRNKLNSGQSRFLAFASDIDSGRLCTCEGTCSDSTHASISPIAEIYLRRKKAQLKRQTDEGTDRGTDGQWRRIMMMVVGANCLLRLIKDMSHIYGSIEDLEFELEANDLPGFDPTNRRNPRRGWIYVEETSTLDQLWLRNVMLKNAWRSHGLCKRFSTSQCEKSGAIFQITFYEMIPPYILHRPGIWKTGTFRNDKVRNWEQVINGIENNNLVLRRSSVTIIGMIDDLQKWSPENWTMLLLTPNTTDIYMDIYEDGAQAVDREFIGAFSGIIDRSTRAVVRHWDILANYLEKLLSESDPLLQPDLHDLLLVDDSKYSKSKKYFWALNILKEIESDIAAVILQLEGFMDFSEHSPLNKQYPLPDGGISTEREKIVKKKLGLLKEDLTRLQSRFSDQRELTKDLRDGLFNASAVMESRASTRLGENVRLLTFVSIFFLPLSFTMDQSIWSINDSALAHINIMIGVAVVLGIITYLVVFNVDNVVFFSNQIIKKLKAGAIEHMKNNDNDVWKQRGEGLTEPAFANEQNVTHSSWRIPQYVWLLAWKWITTIVVYIWTPMRRLSERLAKKKVEQMEEDV
ncbi:hypothetical protein BOTCAL_0182g00160 [Botryotinia calthae]|uniref:Uncharacterized protein n=1 Tax=Botryotinia calthae TaxID=38488 RepID=A0A4Y8D129_9HELO|nr:hypothetical protein BOTCAL_0182g00160 [Botryotinia calthae]